MAALSAARADSGSCSHRSERRSSDEHVQELTRGSARRDHPHRRRCAEGRELELSDRPGREPSSSLLGELGSDRRMGAGVVRRCGRAGPRQKLRRSLPRPPREDDIARVAVKVASVYLFRYSTSCAVPSRKKPTLACRFYRTATGNEPVREWLKSLSLAVRREVGSDIQVVQWRWPVGKPLV